MTIVIRAILLAAAVGCPAVLFAQPPPVTLAPEVPARWEAAGLVGWVRGSHPAAVNRWDRWHDVASIGGSAAFYVTPHLKGEISITSSREAMVLGPIAVPAPGQQQPLFRVEEHRLRTDTALIGMQYQFGENQWIHPFVGAGLDVSRERDRIELPPQFISSRGVLGTALSGGPQRTTTAYTLRPAVSGGLKFYVNDRTFVRTDVQTALGRDRLAYVTWRGGIGVEF